MTIAKNQANRPGGARGFTLIEIMVALAIAAVMIGVGIPTAWRALQRDDLARAVHDTIEGCKTARDRAILQGVPYEFIVQENGSLNVQASAIPNGRTGSGGSAKAADTSPYAAFPRQLGEDVMIQLIGVNFIDMMQEPEARVRFYPNGTCDEFTVVYNWKGKQRTVTVDIITGTPDELVAQ